ncbi:FAD-dependent monooxygenase [Amycolatopsis endophytica]|uniref:2-polyprenyl-6-methoxyphenol hydroxylase-like FAD-dependent oxidoreductase n=1 Tax=Amycolatopsis endophytica TaxID=860233 RepID=A0A853AY20_9PSEU|nr:FAD-dependent monooxygenase [Amycolatopsis endophytica]NYI87515.1 2-polyprenyl-6-methoxyphenol hydroxylase-like FAD-dependent oxidoreductase [Amycolatopsis endophytica]
MDVLIAGAGPTGLTLAIDLARRGVDVRIVDKATEFFPGSRGDGLQPRTMEVFDDLGVIDAVLAASREAPALHAYMDGKFVMERVMFERREPMPDVPYPNARMLGQAQTEGILRDRLAEFGVRVELGAGLTGFTQDEGGVTAQLSTGETVRADYLVGADGGRSFVRKALGIEFEGVTDESIRMLLGDVAADLDPEFGYWFSNSANPMRGIMMSPLPGIGLFQFGAPLGEEDVEPTVATLQSKLDALDAGVRLREMTWSTVWRPNVRLAKRFRDGRVFLAGDAAHVHPPTGGQGLNTGVQDAYNLGWKLADGSPELLDSYEIERRAVAAHVLGLSSELMRKYTEGDESAHERGEDTQQLDISYRTTDSPGLAVGDRAPDAPLVGADGKAVRLFDLFRGPHATTLLFDGSVSTQPHTYTVLRSGETSAGNSVTDVEGHAFKAYEAVRVTVRPDGYVGALSR